MEFNDINDIIYHALKDDYLNREDFYSLSWNEYLIEIDIGIQYNNGCRYKIIDKQKYMLSKIKYGI